MGLKESKLWEKIISTFCASLIPALLTLGLMLLYKHKHGIEELDDNIEWIITIIGIISTIVSYVIIYGLLPRFRAIRQLGIYEGRWLEIIPKTDTKRPYSIIDFTFNQATLKYELNGFNFHEDLKSGVYFEAYRFVERSFRNGFYFITNSTSEHKNGLGKICFVKPNYDKIVRAEGYFFDSGIGECSKKYNTILIKLDKKFYNIVFHNLKDNESNKTANDTYGSEIPKLSDINSFKQFKNLSPEHVMFYCKDFAEEQKKEYMAMHNDGLKKATCPCTKRQDAQENT